MSDDIAARLEVKLTGLLASCDDEEASLLVDMLAVAYQALEMDQTAAAEVEGFAGGGLDSLSDLGESQQFRLQMNMDRRSKSAAILSNILKKQSDTASSITQNLK
jgi:hypothetical protein